MPLLRRQPFHRQKPPPDLDGDEEVFHCKLTNEIFRDYEEFFERIILCNSLVWSCSITGRAGLTYQEAIECEEKALKNLATFPGYLQKPVLFLANLTHRTRLVDMNDDIFVFAKDRFFIGEVAEVMLGGERKACKILRVIPPSSGISDVNGCIVIDSDEEESATKRKGGSILPAEQYRYVVQERGKNNITITVPSKQISRKKGLYTRDKSKLFLKQYCEPHMGIWRVKNDIVIKRGLDKASFLDFFSGPVPGFEITESKRKALPASKRDEEMEEQDTSGKKKKKKEKEEKSKKEKVEKSPKAKAELELTMEQKAAIKEQLKQQRMAEKMAEKEEKRKKMMEEKQKLREEKQKEREKLMEERRVQLEYLREWNRIRDDMECDDLKVLPEPQPVMTKIPVESFGDAVMVIEFINSFKALFDLKEYFPKGFTFEVLEKALLETDHNGTLTDILLMMITAVFNLQEEEEEEEEALSKKDKGDNLLVDIIDDTDASSYQLIETASSCSQIPQLNHGSLLKKLPLDSFTLSEILRLHLLSSGARGKEKNIKYRYQQRGGYTSQDDPGLDFRRQEQAVLKNLSCVCVFDLEPVDKLKILRVLIQQILTYAATRDTIEDNYERLRQLKSDLKQLQWSEHRREREEAAMRYKRRQEERMMEREKLEQKRLKKLQLYEERLRLQESGLPVPPLPEEEEDDENDVIRSEQEKEEERLQEEEEEANKKAEFALQEKEMVDSISHLQHASQTYPLGRDRMYRRYWVFQSLPGLFIEDCEMHIKDEYLKPVPQNPSSNPFTNGTFTGQQLLPAVFQAPPKKKVPEENGSDKENDSMNSSSVNNSMNLSTADNSMNVSTVSNNTPGNTSVNTSQIETPLTNGASSEGAVDEVVTISDDDSQQGKTENMDIDQGPPMLDSLASKQIMEGPKHMWTYISSTEQFEQLINSLNTRGYRESALKQSLMDQKSRVVELIEKCPTKSLCSAPAVPERLMEDRERSVSPAIDGTSKKAPVKKMAKGLIKGDLAQEVLEINLRELLLDLEERVFVGSLGSLKVKDRFVWRDAIEHGSFEPQTNDPLFTKFDEKTGEKNNDEDSSSVSSDGSTESTVKDLAKALLQIEMAVEPKYMTPPLGESAEKQKLKQLKKKKKEEEEESDGEEEDNFKTQGRSLLERWEDSLLYSTSLSQIFLYMATLEKSIAWSKSALHARCRICRRKGDAEQMLLCDMCDRGHHMYCLKPRLKNVPSGDWYCPDCKPKETKRSPLKNRRRTFSEQSEDEGEEEEEEEADSDEEEGEEEEDEAEEEEDEEEEENNDNLCAVCSKAGMLICCDTCPLSYHLACAKPALKKVPKGKWLCQICSGVEKQGKIKLVKLPVKGGKKASKSTPTSSKASSRKGSPRDSPVTVKNSRKRSRPASPMDEVKPKLKKAAKSMSKLAQDVNGDADIKQVATTSSRGNSKVQHMKICEDLVLELVKHEESTPFLKPVSKKLVPDYHDIIACPMDFSTIRNKINSFIYTDALSIVKDVRLIFSNCAQYNKKQTPEYKAGGLLSKLFEKRLRENHIGIDDSAPPSKKQRRTL
ncbi:bromodomain adjacent to zinc finger domain protein 1A-like [Pecten maximus]|uniref:bromodomain adjacent to zinc finger domain protein 1A-like n=1 Tax=Pecten maximus TaxID=6579 RepID=UPI001458DDEF|nr:bromodomain adjacent to zinc finger domain protein 1A-like [Pecten maximus]XP_033735418.1 bromodomain adjacent to zinc finger domain protein 1A-like [Pecten maximus]